MNEVATPVYFTDVHITQLFVLRNGRMPLGMDEIVRYLEIPEGSDVVTAQQHTATKMRSYYPNMSDDKIVAILSGDAEEDHMLEDAGYEDGEVVDIANEINIEALFVAVSKGLGSHSDNYTSIGALEQHYNATISSSATVTPDLIKRMCMTHHCSPSDLPTAIPSYSKCLSDMHAKEANGVKAKLQSRIDAALEKNTASVDKAKRDLQQLANKGVAEVHLDKAMKLKDYIDYGMSLEKMFDAMDI